ncbi:hypothetical protein [Flammeovirga sp. SJP92]|uniref:hypothetical protein n=1 Tax=Flammeovirga sp. SJP92 TaxID=1775430 RepID=UPI0012FBC22C|nr:hypothetical protein [Flammeovirga sp. SJP92]
MSFIINISLFFSLVVVILWNLRLFPLSKNFYIKDKAELLTGKEFWSWKVFSYDEFGVRGEGYTIDIYEFDWETAMYFEDPDQQFFTNFPKELEYRGNWNRHKWYRTPVINSEVQFLKHSLGHGRSFDEEMMKYISFVRNLAQSEGSYYAFNHLGDLNVDFFLLSPKEKVIVLINHNM